LADQPLAEKPVAGKPIVGQTLAKCTAAVKIVLIRSSSSSWLVMPRSRVGPLALESKLGDHPSQSIVWRAVHVDQQKAVAVKIFSVPFGGTPDSRNRFSKEWEKLKRLQHPAIARCYGGGFEEGDAYLAYELINGQTLSSQLERRSRLAWDEVLDFAIPIAEALVVAHSKGICHGAITPDKILIAGLAPVLIDFRIDRTRSVYRSSRRLTPLEVALQPPEVIADPSAISPRGDLYSLGAVMFLALTGRPPISGDSIQEVTQNVRTEVPPKAASIALDCPVWVSSLVEQALEKDIEARPHDARSFALALTEARRRSSGLAGVAEHASSGFSPLQVTRQTETDEARKLLGKDLIDVDEEVPDATPLHEKAWFLISVLILILVGMTWLVWPLSESQMRSRAEALIAEETRSSLEQAKKAYLHPMLKRFPDGEHSDWAADQIDAIEMIEAEHALAVKLNRNLPIRDEGERLFADAQRFERFGDKATALDKYKSMETLLADNPKYKPYVNLARRQIGRIRSQTIAVGEATNIVQAKLHEAEQLARSGNVIAARDIWYSVIELYSDNSDVGPMVRIAQQRLSGSQPALDP
jgi:eukaryotic-like serine/threonine-protein kinase